MCEERMQMYLEYIVCVHNYLKGVGATAYRDDSQHDQVDWFACNQARRLCHWKVDKQVVVCFLYFIQRLMQSDWSMKHAIYL
jgi:hypothetical protein